MKDNVIKKALKVAQPKKQFTPSPELIKCLREAVSTIVINEMFGK